MSEDNHKKYAESKLDSNDSGAKIFKQFTRGLTKVAIRISKNIN